MREHLTNRRLALGSLVAGVLLFAFVLWYVFLPAGHVPTERSPMAGFDHQYAATNDSLVVRQIGGDRLTGRITVSVTDAETNTTETVVWHHRGQPRPLRWDVPLVLTDQDGDGPTRFPAVAFDLDSGDRVRIRYEGDPPGGDEATERITLEDFVIG